MRSDRCLHCSIRGPPSRLRISKAAIIQRKRFLAFGRGREVSVMQFKRLHAIATACALTPGLALPAVAANNVVANPICTDNTANFNPTLPPSVVLPPGFTASVFRSGLNFPTGIAFLGDSQSFQVFVLESGHGLGGSRCNEQGDPAVGGTFSSTNPFTPDILVFNRNGTLIRGPLGKPTPS